MSYYLLDSDHLSLLRRGHPEVVARVGERSPAEIAISIISIEEQFCGWFTQVRKARNQRVDDAERTIRVTELKRTYFGGANLDGQFNSGDLVIVFVTGKYESGASAEWQDGDWNGDGQFNSRDFVVAFTEAGYEKGPRAASPVPEPSSVILLGVWVLGFSRRSVRRPIRSLISPSQAPPRRPTVA
jgi:hypothetical protein